MDGQAQTMDWISPWFTIWTSPRATIRKIVDSDPRKFVLGIMWTAGALGALNLEVSLSQVRLPEGNDAAAMLGSPIVIAVLAFVLGVFAVIALYASGALLKWSGGILGGTASAVEVRSAIAWSNVPEIYLTTVGIILMIAGLYTPSFATSPAAAIRSSFSAFNLLVLIVGIWAFVIQMKCLGEVHHFSAWRAFASILVGLLAVAGTVLAIVLVCTFAVMIGRSLA